jgi:hypothetical protein
MRSLRAFLPTDRKSLLAGGPMIRARRLLLAAIACAAAAAPLRAQTVTGHLLDPSGKPVAQVLVALIDAAGHQRAAGLSGASGAFTIRAPAAGRYTLRAERIGYASTASPAFDLRDGEAREQPLTASDHPVALQAITVTPQARRCAVRPGAGVATAALWEEARKALNATAFGQRERLFRYDVVMWNRDLDPHTLAVLHDERRTASGDATSPFVSAPPEQLGREGYVRRIAGDTLVFSAPDADALLSDEFLNDHCFKVATTADDASLVGLEFQPTSGRSVSDIRGVLWLDRGTAELRRLEYSYVNGPREAELGGVGGRVEFGRVQGGPWIVKRWNIRMPGTRLESRRENGTAVTELMVERIREAGGEVTSAVPRAGAAVTFGAPKPVVEGVVWDSTRNAPLAGARVFLSGTAAEATTGADGTYRLEAPADGRYTLAVAGGGLGPVAAAVAHPTVTVAAGQTARIDLAVPGAAAVVRAICDAGALREQHGVVMGQVRGLDPAAAEVVAHVARYTLAGGGSRFAGRSSAVTVKPDASGFYVVCGLPESGTVELFLRSGGRELTHEEVPVRGLTRRDLAAAP